jgi:hypothetical protein
MKKLITVFLFLNLYTVTYNQIIKGTILDKNTKSPIAFATVYFNTTSVGAYTDDKGFFKLDIGNISSMPLTISALGYYSTNISDYSPNRDILVYLTPKVFELNEVVVIAKGKENARKQNLDLFRKEFLGRTESAKECEIANEDDIRFITSTDKDTLKAFSLKPIIIINKRLGYKITYFLNKFEYVNSTFVSELVGNALFVEDTTSILTKEDLEDRRLKTYLGSKMHFFRSLWQNDLYSTGFIVSNSKGKLTYYDLVRFQLSTDPRKAKTYLFYPEPSSEILSIKWLPGKAESGMEIFNSSIYFDKNGYYEGQNIIWHGEMAKQQIADMLPFDYQPSEKLKE